MGESVFFLDGHLREGATIALGGDEDRVVAKATLAPLTLGDRALSRPVCHALAAVGESNERDRAKARRSLARAEQFAQCTSTIARVVRRLATPSRRANARFAAERVDLQSRVVGHCSETRREAHRDGLQTSVADQGGLVLVDLGQSRRPRKQIRDASQEVGDFRDLVRIGRGADDAHITPSQRATRRGAGGVATTSR